MKDETLIKVSIYEFDTNNDFVKRIEAASANISTSTWILKSVKIIDSDGQEITAGNEISTYNSVYNIEKIKTLYANLDTVSFWKIENEMKLLEERGYSTKDMEAKLQRSFAFPFFLVSMVLLSGVFTLGMRFRENNGTYVFIIIFFSKR